LRLRGLIALADLRQLIVECLQPSLNLKTIGVGFAFQLLKNLARKKNARMRAILQSLAQNF